jgi:hypothetical protein
MALPKKLTRRTFFLLRTCEKGCAYLTPADLVQQILLYSWLTAQAPLEITINGYTCWSNGFALFSKTTVVTITKDETHLFMQNANRETARAVKKVYGIPGKVLSDGSYEPEPADTEEQAIEALAQMFAMPVRKGLVRRPEHWPGLTSYRMPFGTTLSAPRPGIHFGKDCPAVSTGILTKPAALAHLSDEEVMQRIEARVEELVAEIHAELAAEGRRFLGADRVLAANPHQRPRQLFQACGGKGKAKRERERLEPYQTQKEQMPKISSTWRAEHREFVRRYKRAMVKWRDKIRDVLFPVGTYWMRVWHRASVAPG